MDNYYLNSAKASDKLDKAVLAALVTALGLTGAVLPEGADFICKTDAGYMRGCMYAGDRLGTSRKWSPAWVHIRFDNPKEAQDTGKLGTRLNSYSGKWNWHFGGDEAHNEATLSEMVKAIRGLNPRNVVIA